MPPSIAKKPSSGAKLEVTLLHSESSRLPSSESACRRTSRYVLDRNPRRVGERQVTGQVVNKHAGQQIAREQRLYHYLADIRDREEISASTADAASKMWQVLKQMPPAGTGKALPVPDASPGPDGELLYVWNKDEHHFELEFIPGAPMEFFYRNRNTGAIWGTVYSQGEDLPEEVIDRWSILF
jgi:hypothetical protein